MENCFQTHQQSTVVDQQTSDVQLCGVECPGTKSEISGNTKTNIAHALWMKEYDESKIPQRYLDKIHSCKNNPQQFAARRSGQMQNYLNNPVFLNPDYTERYNTLLEYTNGKELSPQQIRYMSFIVMHFSLIFSHPMIMIMIMILNNDYDNVIDDYDYDYDDYDNCDYYYY